MRVRRGAERPSTATPGVLTRHGLSFGAHYDPAWTHHGVLLAHNEDVLAPGAGYDPHPHRDVELLTWVLAGTLRHHDPVTGTHDVPPGWVQRVSAGAGVVHSERHAGGDDAPVHLLQLWLAPDGLGGPVRHDAGPAAGLAEDSVGGTGMALGSTGTTLRVGTLVPGAERAVPAAAHTHLWVATGSATLAVGGRSHALGAGDSALLSGTAGVLHGAAPGTQVALLGMARDLADLLPG